MRRSSRINGESQPGPSSQMEVDSDSDNEEEPVSQVSKSMKKINVSQNSQKGKSNRKQVNSDSQEESRVLRNSQKMNTSNKGPKGKTTRRIIQDIDDEEEPQPSTSQASQKRRKNNTSQFLSQASTSRAAETFYGEEISASQISPNTSLTEQELNHHVANVVKYILAADLSNIPIEKSKISKSVNCHNKKFKDVFKSAQEILKDVFGYELLDLEEKNVNQAVQVKPGKYILINTVNCDDEIVKNLSEDIDEEHDTRYVLLFLCLSHIFMSGDKCSEHSLKSFLKKLEIVTDNHAMHEYFGDAMETVKNVFTKEKYINYKDEEFTWGVRAVKELKPRAVMEFISMIYGDRELKSWPREYERLLAKERQQNERVNG